jgi:hypothetical protein
MATQGTTAGTQASSRTAGQMTREEEKGGCRPLQPPAACLPCSMYGFINSPNTCCTTPHTLHTAEHFLAFLMNYQDPQTLKNKYIDQLVRQQQAAASRQ